MSIRTQIRGGLMAMMVIGFTASTALAQMIAPYPVTRNNQRNNMMNPNARPPVEQRTPFEGSGVVEGAGPLGLAVNANGMSWKVKPDKNCKIEVTGTADPDFLKPGLWVKFNSDIDKKTKATAPVNELEIVDQRTAMVNEKGRGGLTGTDAGAKKGKGAATGVAANSGPILGKITAYKNNELTLETGSGTVKADLGPNPSIKVNVSDFAWAQPGDTVDVKGWYMQPGAAMAQDIKVTLKNPLGENPKKKPAAKSADKAAK